MEKRIIIDFDNTMGVKGCDVDDGLALLFLLGTPGVSVEAACTTFGNNTLETVHENTLRLFGEWGLDIPVYRGAASKDDEPGEAARFLAQAAAENPGELSIVATGSLTNLRHAVQLDPAFFSNVREIAVMGGITESLAINGRIMDELNFSCDPAATLAVLSAPCPVTDATAHACLPAFFRREDFAENFGEAAVARPDLLSFDAMDVTLYERLLSVGYLEAARAGAPSATIRIPRIDDSALFVRESVEAWRRALGAMGLA